MHGLPSCRREGVRRSSGSAGGIVRSRTGSPRQLPTHSFDVESIERFRRHASHPLLRGIGAVHFGDDARRLAFADAGAVLRSGLHGFRHSTPKSGNVSCLPVSCAPELRFRTMPREQADARAKLSADPLDLTEPSRCPSARQKWDASRGQDVAPDQNIRRRDEIRGCSRPP